MMATEKRIWRLTFPMEVTYRMAPTIRPLKNRGDVTERISSPVWGSIPRKEAMIP